MIPEFDPQAKAQSMKDWLSKINETATVYGWSEQQIIYYSLPQLTGLAKRYGMTDLPALSFRGVSGRTNCLGLSHAKTTTVTFLPKR